MRGKKRPIKFSSSIRISPEAYSQARIIASLKNQSVPDYLDKLIRDVYQKTNIRIEGGNLD